MAKAKSLFNKVFGFDDVEGIGQAPQLPAKTLTTAEIEMQMERVKMDMVQQQNAYGMHTKPFDYNRDQYAGQYHVPNQIEDLSRSLRISEDRLSHEKTITDKALKKAGIYEAQNKRIIARSIELAKEIKRLRKQP